MSSVFKATIEYKTTSVTTDFKEIDKERRVPFFWATLYSGYDLCQPG